jgi:hypothetical protein
LLVALGLLGSACGLDGVDGNGERVDEHRELAGFSRVRSDAELDLEITQADTPSVIISIDENLQEIVETRVSEDVLYIDTRKDIGEVVSGPHVLIQVPELLAAKLAGSGRITTELDQPELPFDLFLTGSGVMTFSGRAAVVGAYLSGSGDLKLSGETSDFDAELSGSGSIRAKSLLAESGSLDLDGSGDISASITESVTISLSGSGSIDLYGNPSIDGYEQTGSGDINQH